MNEDGAFKSADDLRRLYGGKGIDGSRETIAYCRIGERSSQTWFVLTQLLGFQNGRNYDSSWAEWGSIIGAPIEKPRPLPTSWVGKVGMGLHGIKFGGNVIARSL